ncbi:trigger factor [Deinococcus xinjiangensis]|uniref:Peptidyl-prolyl cis-trans isomerase n=2 Tax=Deinococcus xinjiangensis TaxID=457454 RepID=A0ABP9VDF0_9DEIO
MQITQGKVVELDYKLTVRGEVIDQSAPNEPLTYVQGSGELIAGLERALEGKSAGDTLQVTVQPEDGYGERDPESILTLPRADFDNEVAEGETYYTQVKDGSVMPFTVLSLEGDKVTVDFNTPLAGETLHFDVKVLSVRDQADTPAPKPRSAPTPTGTMNGGSMNVAKDKVVDLDYKLTVQGEVIDQSEAGEPLVYLHGHSNIIPGLERALEGKAVGDTLQVTVQPEDGYGERDEDAIEELSREDFDDDIEVGATYYAQAEDGSVIPFTVLAVDGDHVKVDFNPPLAGQVLNFDVKVLGVRDATAEELDHGHAHTPDMHE